MCEQQTVTPTLNGKPYTSGLTTYRTLFDDEFAGWVAKDGRKWFAISPTGEMTRSTRGKHAAMMLLHKSQKAAPSE